MNDKSLESVLSEQRVFSPSDKFKDKARVRAEDVASLLLIAFGSLDALLI